MNYKLDEVSTVVWQCSLKWNKKSNSRGYSMKMLFYSVENEQDTNSNDRK